MPDSVKGDKNRGDKVSKAPEDKSAVSKPHSHRTRRLLPPHKRGTIKQSVIRKAIKEIMAEQSTPS